MGVVATLGPDGQTWGTPFLYNLIGLMAADGVTVTDVSSAEKTIALTSDGTEYKADLTGTNVTSNGTITSLSFLIGGAINVTFSNLSIAATDITAALNEADASQRHTDVVNLFAGTDWQADFTAAGGSSLVFGSGGNDQFTLGSADDFFMLDGGSDNSSTGDGADFIYARNIESYSAAGTSTIDGSEGNDTLALDIRDEAGGIFGPDTIDLFAKGRTVDLTKTFIDGSAVAQLLNIENIRGTRFGDKLYGDGGGNVLQGEEGNDTLVGRGGWDMLNGDDGNDSLTGGPGGDKLTGGAGADHFIYTSAKDSVVALDLITDFHRRQDKIDFSGLPLPKKGEFTLIGDHKFGHHAGEIQFDPQDFPGKENDYLVLAVDLDGNAKADLTIVIDALLSLGKTDFFF